MSWTRRHLLKVGSGVAASQALWVPRVVGCNSGKPLPKLLHSKAPLPEKFRVELPRVPLLNPTSTQGNEDRYSLKAVAASAKILPELGTTIWGFNGTFPGPTIEARRGRPVVLSIDSELSVPIVNHLHGGRTPPNSDGYPTDLIMPRQGWPSEHMHDRLAKVVKGIREYIYPNDQRAATL